MVRHLRVEEDADAARLQLALQRQREVAVDVDGEVDQIAECVREPRIDEPSQRVLWTRDARRLAALSISLLCTLAIVTRVHVR